jgi:hypothetical protein
MWMNSLNLGEGAHPTINNLMTDLADGVAIVETGLAIAGEEVAGWMGARKLNRGTPEKPLNKCVRGRADERWRGPPPLFNCPPRVVRAIVSQPPSLTPRVRFGRPPARPT